jgi:hypothetical protein
MENGAVFVLAWDGTFVWDDDDDDDDTFVENDEEVLVVECLIVDDAVAVGGTKLGAMGGSRM